MVHITVALFCVLIRPTLLFDCVAMLPDGAAISVVGAFTNMVYTEEHAYGYTVELWQSGDCVFGFFLESAGLQGDTPAGLLEDVAYDKKKGSFSFRARLTQGLFSDREHHMVPSRDIFEFKGVYSGAAIQGSLHHANALTPGKDLRDEQVILKRSITEAGAMVQAATYGEWRRAAERILAKHI